VGNLVFGAVVGLGFGFGEKQVDLAVAHLDAVVDFTLAQARQHDLLAQLLAPGLERDIVALEGDAEIGEAHVVALRHALHRAIELQLVDADALVARELRLRLVEDQALEHLALEQAALRQRGSLPAQLALRRRHRLAELGRRDHFLVDHGHDAVDRQHALRRHAGGKEQCEEEFPHALKRPARTAAAGARSAARAWRPPGC